ncbi:MAG: S9 family peptidase [Pseudomonadota bacterium]
MITKTIAPFGTWKSSISAAMVAAGSTPLSLPRVDGTNVYWLEGRATESGRHVIVKHGDDENRADINPAPFNVRSRAHEYGGGSYLISEGTVYFSNFADNQIYQMREGEIPQPVTQSKDFRYADFLLDRNRNRLIAIREDHTDANREAINQLVAISLNGSGQETILAEGYDFYSSPRLSPDGSQLAWLCWNHPNMPWDGCELQLALIDKAGTLSNIRKIAGGESESIFQPEWSSDGKLYFVSDRTGWWNLYRAVEGGIIPLCPMEAEFGRAQWVFGMTMYGFARAEEIICVYVRQGMSSLASLNLNSGTLIPITTPYTDIQDLQVGNGFAAFLGGSSTRPMELVHLDLGTGGMKVLAQSVANLPEPAMLSIAQVVSFPTTNGRTAHGFYYAPINPDFSAAETEKPPLIVISHGGPTGMTTSTLRMNIQYWTSRGFAVLDVNYGGSTGYGRVYRESLNGQWGVVDVDDCENGALHLTTQELADAERLIIRGGSAGGFTTLCALTFRKTFKAGASHYGVSDLAALSADTHKFESRYDIRLVGSRDLYHERSPIHHADQISCPVIFFQGLDDKVVPPEQSERMVNALQAQRIPVAYITYEGEGHGFRKAENIQRTLEAELYFYSSVFEFSLAEAVIPVEIHN